jgi:hypothetical protein
MATIYSRLTALGVVSGALIVAGCASSSGAPPAQTSLARTCAGIGGGSQEVAMSTLRPDIDRVEPLYDSPCCKAPKVRAVGATIHVRGTPNVSAEWIGRLLECDADRFASGASCTGNTCVLAVPGTRASVSTVADGYAIELRAGNTDAAQQIMERARLLLDDSSNQNVAQAQSPTRH